MVYDVCCSDDDAAAFAMMMLRRQALDNWGWQHHSKLGYCCRFCHAYVAFYLEDRVNSAEIEGKEWVHGA
eukprot:scaffold50117_cov46-Cyclotella_meneghiniana.AAC.1